MAKNVRLPAIDSICRDVRDAKLLNHKEHIYNKDDDEDRHEGRRQQKVKCKFNLYIESSWSRQNRVMALQYVMQIGCQPICRGITQVCLWPLSLQTISL